MSCVMNYFFTATPVQPTITLKLKSQKTPKRNYFFVKSTKQNETGVPVTLGQTGHSLFGSILLFVSI